MSGSNSLAAAKRRRGTIETNKGPLPPGSSRPLQNSSQPPPGTQLNPMQIVMMNHQRLNSLQNELPKAIDTLGENFNALSSNCDFLHEQVSSLKEELTAFKSSKQTGTPTPSSNNDNDKLNKLETDISESHKIVLKMQSFTMELSIQLTKMKDDYETRLLSFNKRLDEFDSLFTNNQKELKEIENKLQEDTRKMKEDYQKQLDEFMLKFKNMSHDTNNDVSDHTSTPNENIQDETEGEVEGEVEGEADVE